MQPDRGIDFESHLRKVGVSFQDSQVASFDSFLDLTGNKGNDDMMVGADAIRQAKRRTHLSPGQIIKRKWNQDDFTFHR